tara:strand:- start:1165 stop:1989 length:825 start_codon:yes stop_codon:yes gene_type:complete
MIVWLVSYPKSGNTWVRAFLSTYFHSSNNKFNYNLLNKISEFPQHDIINKFMQTKDFHNLGEVSKNWIKTQNEINLNKKVTFLKTHSALCNVGGNVFTNKDTTLVFIYIVRDPRNIILSLSNHFGFNQEKSLEILTDEKYTIYPKNSVQNFPATHVSSWKNHYCSWKNCTSINNIIIKYEDLISNPYNTFKKLVLFLNKYAKIKYDDDKLTNSIKATQFENLKNYEKKYGFKMGQKNKFFHLGKNNNWKSLLNKKIESEINNQFESSMKELGYI